MVFDAFLRLKCGFKTRRLESEPQRPIPLLLWTPG